MNSKVLVFSLMLVAVCQCASASADAVVKESAVDIVYSKDSRTGLCFGTASSYASSWYKVASITNVPCEALEHPTVK